MGNYVVGTSLLELRCWNFVVRTTLLELRCENYVVEPSLLIVATIYSKQSKTLVACNPRL